MKNDELLSVAKLGKTIGLQGELKIYFLSDFPEQFRVGAVFFTEDQTKLEVEKFNSLKALIKFVGFSTPESSQNLVNTILYTTKEQSRKECNLNENEFFWFDLIGCKIIENDEVLGNVSEISRIANQDYLVIKTNKALIEKALPKSFLIPYIDRYIQKTSLEDGCILTKDAFLILENS